MPSDMALESFQQGEDLPLLRVRLYRQHGPAGIYIQRQPPEIQCRFREALSRVIADMIMDRQRRQLPGCLPGRYYSDREYPVHS